MTSYVWIAKIIYEVFFELENGREPFELTHCAVYSSMDKAKAGVQSLIIGDIVWCESSDATYNLYAENHDNYLVVDKLTFESTTVQIIYVYRCELDDPKGQDTTQQQLSKIYKSELG